MKTWTRGQLLSAVVGIAAIVGASGAAVVREPAGADITLPGSPLYTVAVTESVKGQSGEKEPEPEPTPCPDCGQIHARPDQSGPGHSAPTAAASSNYVYCTNCKAYHRVAPTVQIGAPTP